MLWVLERRMRVLAIKMLGGTALIVILFLLSACATIPAHKRPQVRKELLSTSEKVLADIIAEDPAIEAEIDKSVGYFAGDATSAMVVLVGAGGTIGVLYDKQKNERYFLNINALDVGLGISGTEFKLLVLFKTTEAMEKAKEGLWTAGTTAASMSGKHGGMATMEKKGWKAHVLAKSGVSLGAAFTISKVGINEELTDMGVSDVRMPTVGLDKSYQQGEAAPRKWNRILPILGQKVVDKGFDLPLPWGIGLTAADVDQKMDLELLAVGFNGGTQRPIPSAIFYNTNTHTQSVQVKLDAWLFPFLNVFGMVGQVQGDFNMDVDLDGNTILDEIGANCSGARPPRICGLLQDKTVTLPVESEMDAITWGVGAVLAGGYKNWFFSLPMSANWTTPSGAVADGVAYTITPRGGYLFNLGGLGYIAAFGGGNWLQSEFTIDGTYSVADDVNVDYVIEQESRDNWTLLLGFNWDISRHFSWSFEYNGFIGSREAYISSMVFRF